MTMPVCSRCMRELGGIAAMRAAGGWPRAAGQTCSLCGEQAPARVAVALRHRPARLNHLAGAARYVPQTAAQAEAEIEHYRVAQAAQDARAAVALARRRSTPAVVVVAGVGDCTTTEEVVWAGRGVGTNPDGAAVELRCVDDSVWQIIDAAAVEADVHAVVAMTPAPVVAERRNDTMPPHGSQWHGAYQDWDGSWRV